MVFCLLLHLALAMSFRNVTTFIWCLFFNITSGGIWINNFILCTVDSGVCFFFINFAGVPTVCLTLSGEIKYSNARLFDHHLKIRYDILDTTYPWKLIYDVTDFTYIFYILFVSFPKFRCLIILKQNMSNLRHTVILISNPCFLDVLTIFNKVKTLFYTACFVFKFFFLNMILINMILMCSIIVVLCSTHLHIPT